MRVAAWGILGLDAVARLCEQGYVVREGLLDRELTVALRRDVEALREAGQFQSSRIGTRTLNNRDCSVTKDVSLKATTRSSQTCWLRPRPSRRLGDADTRDALDEFVDELRRELAAETGVPLAPFVLLRRGMVFEINSLFEQKTCEHLC